MRQINLAGLNLIKGFETFVPVPYDDGYGYRTIGWGHLIRPGEHYRRLTPAEGDALLLADLASAEHAVERLVTAPLADNQFGALVSLVFNIGGAAFEMSTMRRLLNRREYAAAADEFPKWNRSRGKVSNGLVRRRAAERELFLRTD